jgi:hypothetical protein
MGRTLAIPTSGLPARQLRLSVVNNQEYPFSLFFHAGRPGATFSGLGGTGC